MPGLYQSECERLVEFEQQHQDLDAGDVLKPAQSLEQEFFAPAELIRCVGSLIFNDLCLYF